MTIGVDNNGDGSTADRPVVNGIVVPRNWGKGTPVYDMGISLEKQVRISERVSAGLRAEGFNLLNRDNIYGRNGVYGNAAMPSATFGTAQTGINNVDPSRQFQFHCTLRF